MIPSYRVFRLDAPLRLDGDTTKPAWMRCPSLDLVDVVTGAPPRQPTTVRLAHFDGILYAAFCCEDTDIWGTYRQHDDPLYEEEVVEVFLDPDGLGQVYYELQVSPHGVQFDAKVLNRQTDPEGPRDLTTWTDWNPPGFIAAVKVTGELDTRRDAGTRWEVELALPLREMGSAYTPGQPPSLRANLFRIDRHANGDEYQAWSPTGRIDFHVPSRFGALKFDS